MKLSNLYESARDFTRIIYEFLNGTEVAGSMQLIGGELAHFVRIYDDHEAITDIKANNVGEATIKVRRRIPRMKWPNYERDTLGRWWATGGLALVFEAKIDLYEPGSLEKLLDYVRFRKTV